MCDGRDAMELASTLGTGFGRLRFQGEPDSLNPKKKNTKIPNLNEGSSSLCLHRRG